VNERPEPEQVPAPDEAREGEAAVGPPADPESGLPAAVGEAVRAAVHGEFDAVLGDVIEALRRHDAVDVLNDRLRAAERRLEARRERPVIAAVYQLLDQLRHFEFDEAVKGALEDSIVKLLSDAGFEETGKVGEPYDQARHKPLGGRAINGKGTVARVHTRGLSSFGDVVFRATVEVSPPKSAPQGWPYKGSWRETSIDSGQ
jgi:hypothetical protein